MKTNTQLKNEKNEKLFHQKFNSILQNATIRCYINLGVKNFRNLHTFRRKNFPAICIHLGVKYFRLNFLQSWSPVTIFPIS